MSVAIQRARAFAERQMTLTLTAYSPSGITKDADGFDVRGYTSQGTTIGKVRSDSQAGGDTAIRYVEVAGVSRPVLTGALHIPIAATIPTAGEQRGKGWEYVVTAVGAGDDPALLNRRYLVVGVPAKSKATARRLDVVEV